VREELNAVFARILEARPEARVVSWASTGDSAFVSDDGRTTFGLVFLRSEGEGVVGVADIQQALAGATVAGEPVHVTGRPALSTQTDEGGTGVLIETLVGGVGALVVLLYIFGSALALLPLIVAAISILTSFLLIGGVTAFTDVNFIVQFLIALIGLGVAIDYALLVVNRWREERAAGYPNELAVQRAMETAGHAVIFSGTTVGIGLVALVALPMPFFRGIGIGGMLIPLVSVLVTITLLPVILATIGPKVDWPRFQRSAADSHRGWEHWGWFVVRHRWASTALGLGLLALLLIPATQLAVGEPRPDALNGTGDAQAGLVALELSGIDAGVMSPLEIIVQGDPAAVAGAVDRVEGVRGAVAPNDEMWRANGTALITVIPQGDGGGAFSRGLVDRVREVTHQQAGEPLVGSFAAGSADFIDDVYGNFPLMMLLVGVVTYVFLVRAFRSLLLPLKALVLNVLSVAAAYGVLVLVWQFGWGSEAIWGIPSTGSITDWIPVMIFAFLFGLSMDYEVFILHRMREEYDAGGSTDTAIVRGLAMTGKLVTCAALILFLAFVAMAATPETEIRMMATGLAAGIIIDATVIRAFLVPALISLMGRWNWWLPGWLDWIAPKPTTVAAPAIAHRRDIASASGSGE
jgi:RND superfamily putative drug exporter